MQDPEPPGPKYRPEIDGLRAISVLAVVLFHANFTGFAGGFLGVDVFFVISGFLITGILIEENRAGDFSILRFYERRIRRILPALYLVLAVSFLAALYLMLPSGLVEFARSAAATLFFVSNGYFWRNTDYFGPNAEVEPLIHTWSLGVEEQYYLFFPLLVLLLWRFGIPRLATVIAVATVASLALSEVLWRVAPEANFFLLPSRAWELGIGSLGAFLWHRPGGLRVGRATAEVAAGAGLVLVLGSLLLLDAGTPSPSLRGAPPVVGAALILLFATRGTLVARLLSVGPMVGIGLVSYSAYLWHQPLFAFARLSATDVPGPATMAVLSVVTFLLAWATLVLVERPFRSRAFIDRRRIFLGAAGGTVALAASALALLQSGGLRATYPSYLRDAVSMSTSAQGAYVRRAYNKAAERKSFADDGAPRLLLVGDSYSQDFYNMIRETGAFPGYQIVVRFLQARCQIYLGSEDVTPFLEPEDREFCARDAKASDLVDLAHQADVVVFAASWRAWSAERLPTTLANFDFRPEQKVLVIGRKDFAQLNRPMIAGASTTELAALRVPPPSDDRALVAEMRSTLPDEVLVDPYAELCRGWSCPVFTPRGRLISVDGAHLTPDGAEFVGERLFAAPELAPFASRPDASLERNGSAAPPG